jgi:hypothetical protein
MSFSETAVPDPGISVRALGLGATLMVLSLLGLAAAATPASAASPAFTASPSSPRVGERVTLRTTRCSKAPCRYQWQNRPKRGAAKPLHKARFLTSPRLKYVFRSRGTQYVAVRKKSLGQSWTPWRYINGATGRKRARGISVRRAAKVQPGKPGAAPGAGATPGAGAAPGAGGRWIPPAGLTWYWQLFGTLNYDRNAQAYDVDPASFPGQDVAGNLHARGKRAICYVNVGATEAFRNDLGSVPASSRGSELADWPGEFWLDVRDPSVRSVMAARFRTCAALGFDAVEPDNMDGYANQSGLSFTAADQLAYNLWIADQVHALGMAVFQKNDSDQVAALQPSYDGAIVEQCNQSNECGKFSPYVAAGKPVLAAEYSDTAGNCATNAALGIRTAQFSSTLDGTTFVPCW